MKIENLKVKILGIVGTPIKKGNCQFLLEETLKEVEASGHATAEFIHLKDYNIQYCIGCDKCLRRIHKLQAEVGLDVASVLQKEYTCSVKDDMRIIHEKMLEADGIILMAPVYIATIPGQVKTFIDRCRTFVHDFRLQEKVAAPMTVAFYRNAGEDTALDAMRTSLSAMGLNVVHYGAAAVSTKDGSGTPIRETRFAVKEDPIGMLFMQMLAKQIVKTARMMKAGKMALDETCC